MGLKQDSILEIWKTVHRSIIPLLIPT